MAGGKSRQRLALWLVVLLAYPVALAAHGVTAVASAHEDHRVEHYSAHENEDEKERKHGEHASAKRERDQDSRGREARAGDQSGSDKQSAVVTAARVMTRPEPVAAVLVIAGGLTTAAVLTARRRI